MACNDLAAHRAVLLAIQDAIKDWLKGKKSRMRRQGPPNMIIFIYRKKLTFALYTNLYSLCKTYGGSCLQISARSRFQCKSDKVENSLWLFRKAREGYTLRLHLPLRYEVSTSEPRFQHLLTSKERVKMICYCKVVIMIGSSSCKIF